MSAIPGAGEGHSPSQAEATGQVRGNLHGRVEAGGVGAIFQPGGVKETTMLHRPKKDEPELTEKQVRDKARAEAAKEKRTNKYDHGVQQIAEYMAEIPVADLVRSTGIERTPGEDDATYRQKVAETVFQETRINLFGRKTVMREGGNVTHLGLGAVDFGPVRVESDMVKLLNHRRLRGQTSDTRDQVSMWREEMKDRREAWLNAHASLNYYPNQGPAGRVEGTIDPQTIAALMAQGAEGIDAYLKAVPEGEAIHPFQALLGRAIRLERAAPESANQDGTATAAGEAPTAEQASGWMQKVQAGMRQALDRLHLPQDILPGLVNLDTFISTNAERLAGLVSQSPEAIFNARESLLDLQAYSDAVLAITGGRVNILLQLNAAIGEMTTPPGADKGVLSISGLIEHTEAIADDYIVRHPEAGLTKLLNDARRDRIATGGDTPVSRFWKRRAFGTVRRLIPQLRAIDDRGKEDPYDTHEEEKPVVIEGVPPRWWQRGGRHAEFRKMQRAGEKAAKRNLDTIGQSRNAVKQQQEARQQALGKMTTEELEAYLANLDATDRASAVTVEAAGPTAEEQEAATRKQEDADMKAARDKAARLEELYRSMLIAKARGLDSVDDNVRTKAKADRDAARDAAEQLEAQIDARRNPVAAEPEAQEAPADRSQDFATPDEANAASEVGTESQPEVSARDRFAQILRDQAATSGRTFADDELSVTLDNLMAVRNAMIDDEGLNPTDEDVIARARTYAAGNQATGSLGSPTPSGDATS